MDNYLLLAIIALKGVCLFFCWKAISVSSKQKNTRLSKEQSEILTQRMNKALDQNQELQKQLQTLKKYNE
ncbi:hypothetical protein ACERII_11580 [Evansella sp. AB-rgal1]|uniref:hypothetical protein n=1 Tax=Evansella sp. AB-rgal1 TaxID=3242696 RepID=UPI00359CE43F